MRWKFALLAVVLTGAALVSAPPKVEIPPVLNVDDDGDYVLFTPETDATSIVFVGLDGKQAIPLPGSPNTFFFFTRGLPKPEYRFVAVAASKDGEQAKKSFKVVNPGVKPQPDPDPKPDPGPQPKPPVPSGRVARFVVVEDTTQASQFRGQVMTSPKLQAYYRSAGLSHRLISTKAVDPNGGQTAEVKAFLDLARDKPLPYLWTFDSAGNLLTEKKCPLNDAEFIVAIGGPASAQIRRMGNNPRDLRYKWVRYGDPSVPKVPMIPRGQWQETDLSVFLPDVKDQDGIGACNAFACVTAFEACAAQSGLKYARLSPGWLYGSINGGRDQGSMLEDGMQWMIENGTCLSSTVGDLDWRNPSSKRGAAAEAKNYRVVEAYICPNFDAIASALQQGFLIVEGLQWYDNFEPDRDGWLPARGVGSGGGHALCGYGLTQRNGVWGIKTRNSWGREWGKGGDCIIPESLFGQQVGGFWAVRSVVQTPTDWPLPRVELAPQQRPFMVHSYHADFALAP